MDHQAMDITVLTVQRIYRLKCVDKCTENHGCALHKLISRPESVKRGWMLISLLIRNPGERPLSFSSDAWEMTDQFAVSVGGAAVCEKMLPRTYVQADLWLFSGGTSAYTMLAFPSTGAWPAELLCSDGGVTVRSVVSPEAFALKKPRKDAVVRLGKHGNVHIDGYSTYAAPDGRKRYIMIGSKTKRP